MPMSNVPRSGVPVYQSTAPAAMSTKTTRGSYRRYSSMLCRRVFRLISSLYARLN